MSRTYKDSKKGREELLERFDWIGSIPSSFKRTNKRIRKAKEKQALREERDLPVFKKTDAYDFW